MNVDRAIRKRDLTVALALQLATDAGDQAAAVYVLAIAHPTISTDQAVSQTSSIACYGVAKIVGDTLREFGWDEAVIADAVERSVDRFLDRSADLLEAVPSLAGGRA